MSLFEQINTDIKEAMKARDKAKLEALRAVKAGFLVAKTEKGAEDTLSPEKEMAVIQKLVKQRKDSAAIFIENGRAELAEKENLEAEYISVYMPKQLSEDEIKDALKAIIEQTSANSMKDMGKVMGIASKQLAGKADGKLISTCVKALLS